MLLVDNLLQGYGVLSIGAGEGHILDLCIEQKIQRQGLGKTLLKKLFDEAYRQKLDQLLLEVRPSNRAAIALYHSAGFTQIACRKAYYPATDGREDATVMSKKLPARGRLNHQIYDT